MDIFNKYKKYFPYIAGAAFALYAIFGFLGGVDLLWAIFFSANLALGISCFLKGKLEKTNVIAITALAVISLIVVYSLISDLFAFVKIIFSGHFSFFIIIQFLLSLIPGLVHAAAWLLTFAFLLLVMKKPESSLKKFWYAPAACFILSALLGLGVNIIFMFINRSFSFHLIFMIFKEIMLYVIIAVAVFLYCFNLSRDEFNKTEG